MAEHGEGEGPEPGATSEDSAPAAIAMALGGAARGAKLAPEAAAYLQKQSRLLDLQMDNLQEDRTLRHRRLALKFFGDRLRIALELVAVAFGLAIVFGVGVMIWQAGQDRSLVVAAFSAPPDLTARGAGGEALAEDLMGKVAAIRAFANRNSLTHTDDIRADQAEAVKVEIPQTGVSIGELEHFLHRWLGHETLVTGAVRDEPDGQISIGLHVAGADPFVVKGPAVDLDHLLQQAAEKAFAIFDPMNYVIYLAASDRGPEALSAARDLALGDALAPRPGFKRADTFALWANAEPDERRALSRALIAIDLDPGAMVGWMEAANASARLGHDQAAIDFSRRLLATKREDQPPSQREGYSGVINDARGNIDEATGDFAALDADYRADNSSIIERYASRATAAGGRHDLSAGRALLAHALVAGGDEPSVMKARWRVAAAAGDWPSAVAAAKAMADKTEARKATAPGPDWVESIELRLATLYRPRLAQAEALNGDVASAAALIAASPADCYLCARVRGEIAAASGDAAGADRWFGEAVRQGPRLPMAYLEWGQALMARGDVSGSVAKFASAHRWGPHFADPLKGWGDALARQGQRRAALAKYDEALRYAPAWAELRRARG